MWLAAFVLNFLEDMANARTISLRYIQNLNRIGNKFVIRTETKRRTRMEFELQSSLYPMPNSKGQFFSVLYEFFQLEFSFLSKLFQHKFMRRPFTKASDNWTTCRTVEWSRQFSKFFGIHISISNGTFCSNSPLSMDKRIIKCLPKYRSLFVVCA